jgi:TP901-1 family phage major tail protein
MAAQKGLSMLLKLGTVASPTTIAGLQVTTLTINNEMVDVTTKSSSGWRALLAQAGVQSLTITANGTAESDTGFETLQSYAQANSINTMNMIYGDGDTIEGSFQVTKFEVSGAYNKEQTFNITLESSGSITFTNA